MKTKKLSAILLALVYMTVNIIPVFAAAPKFGLDILPAFTV